MAKYTATAFKWTGNYYNATYDESHQVTFTDDDDSFEGGRDSDERVSIDGGAESATGWHPYAIDVDFTDVDGNDHVETFNFFYHDTDGDWYFVPGPDSEFTEGATLGTYQSHTVGWDYADIVCFANGTLIETAGGPVPVDRLQPGDRVAVLDGGFRPLRLNLRRALSGLDLKKQPRLRPVRIVAGALGAGLPERDLRVSRQHRMLVSSPICQRMFGAAQVLITAIRLTECPGCFVDDAPDGLFYHHLVFDRHEIVIANGAPSESFYPGPEAIKALPEAARHEVLDLFPGLVAGDPRGCDPARAIPAAARQKNMVSRHLKNRKHLLAGDLSVRP